MEIRRELDRLLGLVAVVGVSVTTGKPPLIYQISISHLDRAIRTGGPWTYYARPEGRASEVPDSARQNVRLAPEWSYVAPRVMETAADRLLLLYDEDIYHILCAHLPAWEAADVMFAWDLACAGWPDLNMGTSPRGRASASVQASGILAMLEALMVENDVIPPPPNITAHTTGGDVYKPHL